MPSAPSAAGTAASPRPRRGTTAPARRTARGPRRPTAPGGLDRFFFATGEPAGALTLPLPPPPDIEALVRAMTEYGVEMVGPPPVPQG
jgi:hypothetical protein